MSSLRLLTLLATTLLAGCAVLSTATTPERDQLKEFVVEGRFALRVNKPGETPQSAGGRLIWTHLQRGNRILLSSPLGYGLAEIETGPERSYLRTADGKTRESHDPDELIETVTGQRLPVARLSGWLLGQADNPSWIERTPSGQTTRLREAGWQIDYTYPDETAGALPDKLTLTRDGEIELRLRIETWKALP